MKGKKKKTKKLPEEKLINMLDDYDDLLDLLEDTMQEFDQLHIELSEAIDDIQDGLGDARTRLVHCRMKLRRFQPVTQVSYTEEEAPVLPFDA